VVGEGWDITTIQSVVVQEVESVASGIKTCGVDSLELALRRGERGVVPMIIVLNL